jgi:hypothetical protein
MCDELIPPQPRMLAAASRRADLRGDKSAEQEQANGMMEIWKLPQHKKAGQSRS